MIYVVRHGQTDRNKQGRMQGRNGLPLNEEGIRQAEALKEKLQDIKFDYVFSSPQERALQTAEIATGTKPEVRDEINVFDLGEADGVKKDELKLDGGLPDRNIYRGMEEFDDYINRVFGFMDELEEKYGSEDVNILLSGHRCTTGSVGAYFKGIPDDYDIFKYSAGNAEYKSYEFKND